MVRCVKCLMQGHGATAIPCPITFAMADDPVKLGFVRSISRPEGDIAGVILVASESPRSGSVPSGVWLELKVA